MYKFKIYPKLVLCISFVILFCCSCNKSYSEIHTELSDVLSKQYGIFLPDTTELVNAEYKNFAERNPYLTVTFDISGEDIQGAFNEDIWEQESIESAIEGDVGTETSVGWKYDAEAPKAHYYYAELRIKKTRADLYRVYFCGYGVNTQYLK